MHNHDLRDTPNLLVDTIRHFTSLMQNELKLAKAELRHNLNRAGVGVAFFVIAALLALVALNVLASALVAWIAASGLSVGVSALIVGGILMAVAGLLVVLGKNRLSTDALEPERTMANVQRDIATIKEATRV